MHFICILNGLINAKVFSKKYFYILGTHAERQEANDAAIKSLRDELSQITGSYNSLCSALLTFDVYN